MRQGFDPDEPQAHNPEQAHNLDSPFAVGDGEDAENKDRQPPVSDEAMQWETRDYAHEQEDDQRTSPQYGSFREERDVWGDDR